MNPDFTESVEAIKENKLKDLQRCDPFYFYADRYERIKGLDPLAIRDECRRALAAIPKDGYDKYVIARYEIENQKEVTQSFK